MTTKPTGTQIMAVQQYIKQHTDDNSNCLNGHTRAKLEALGIDPDVIENTYYDEVGGPKPYHWIRALGDYADHG